jgi:nucleoid-associated protein YgaU
MVNEMVKSSDPSEAPTARLYRVQEDDDLRSIAVRFYGLADFWVYLYGANAAEITTNGGIRPGQILYVPDF